MRVEDPLLWVGIVRYKSGLVVGRIGTFDALRVRIALVGFFGKLEGPKVRDPVTVLRVLYVGHQIWLLFGLDGSQA